MTSLTKSGYVLSTENLNQNQIKKIRQDLKIQPYTDKPQYGVAPPFNIYYEDDDKIIVPKFYGLNTFGQPDENLLPEPDKIEVSCDISLRDYQTPVINKCINSIKSKEGGVLSVYCGWGKTEAALYIASQIGLKTFILVHTEDLMNQWVSRIQNRFTNARVGIVQQNRCDVDDKDFVIGMVHSVSMKDYTPTIESGSDEDYIGRKPTIFDSFGLVIVDEIHLMATKVFSQAFQKLCCKYSLGLSATPYRADRCHKVFQQFIGDVMHIEKRAPNKELVVTCLNYKIKKFEPVLDKRGDVSYIGTLMKILAHDGRAKELVSQIIKLVKEGRKILILGEYINYLKKIRDLLSVNEYKGFTYGLYIGEMNKDQRTMSQENDVILGTYKLASVGMDIPGLNTLILATPRKEIEQSVGRILRTHGKQEIKPKIIDVIDSFGMFIAQGRHRKGFFKTYGYKIVTVKKTDDPDDPEELEEEDQPKFKLEGFCVQDDSEDEDFEPTGSKDLISPVEMSDVTSFIVPREQSVQKLPKPIKKNIVRPAQKQVSKTMIMKKELTCKPIKKEIISRPKIKKEIIKKETIKKPMIKKPTIKKRVGIILDDSE